MIDRTEFRDVVVIPLNSKIRENQFTYEIKARDNLEKDSVLLCNSIKMINIDRLLLDRSILTTLSDDEIVKVEKILYLLFDCGI